MPIVKNFISSWHLSSTLRELGQIPMYYSDATYRTKIRLLENIAKVIFGGQNIGYNLASKMQQIYFYAFAEESVIWKRQQNLYNFFVASNVNLINLFLVNTTVVALKHWLAVAESTAKVILNGPLDGTIYDWCNYSGTSPVVNTMEIKVPKVRMANGRRAKLPGQSDQNTSVVNLRSPVKIALKNLFYQNQGVIDEVTGAQFCRQWNISVNYFRSLVSLIRHKRM